MKNYLRAFLFWTLLGVTACTKESFPPNQQPAATGQFRVSEVSTDSQGTVPVSLDFDEEIFDNPIEIKSALVYITKDDATIILDSVTHFFNGNCSNAIQSSEDEIKSFSPSEQIAILQEGQLLSKEGRRLISQGSNDTIQLVIKGLRYHNYQLKFNLSKFGDDFSLRLYDNFLKQSTSLPVSGDVSVPFTLKEIDSYSATRFKIIIDR